MAEPDDAPALYRLPPEEFTAARDALAKRLRANGDKAQAEEVRRLRRPNVPAWAVNQVAQSQPDLIDAALAAGSELREAMEIGDGRLLREAERANRQASDAVVAAAEAVMSGAGQSPTDDLRSRVAATVRAAVVDPEVASRLQAGMLERDLELPGFGMDVPVFPTAPPRPRAPRKAGASAAKKAETGADEAERQEERAREEQAERQRQEERRRRDEARKAAKRQLADLEAEAKRLARLAERLAAAADRAEEEAREARADADAAATAAGDAAEKVARAQGALDELDSE